MQEGFKREISPQVEKSLQRRVSNWEVSIEFSHAVTVSDRGIELHVYPTGPNARFWVWVSYGVRGHPIYPRRARSKTDPRYRSALKIYRYSPKTSAGGGYGYHGVKTFVGYAAYVPWWPGIAPRNFEWWVGQEIKQWYQRKMENIVKRATRAANKEARRRWR